MGKNKQYKMDRVRTLSNVTVTEFGEVDPNASYPWSAEKYRGMKQILELGCGKGEHTLALAEADPGRLCVGVDMKSPRICVGADHAIDQGLDNVLFLRAHIEQLRAFFGMHTIHEIWLTFPDPFPKERCIKNRLTGPGFLSLYADLLVPRGTVHLKTDSQSLFAFTRESVSQSGGTVIAMSEDIHGTGTQLPVTCQSAFETKALLRGEKIHYLAFTLDNIDNNGGSS